MSMLGNTKSNSHRKTCHVESDATSRKIAHLTRGDLQALLRGEVSRGRSSVEVGESQRSEGLKNYATDYIRNLLSNHQVCTQESLTNLAVFIGLVGLREGMQAVAGDGLSNSGKKE